MQGNASDAFNEFLRFPLIEELSSNPALCPLLRVATAMLYCRPSTLYVSDSSYAYGPAMRIPSTRGVHQGCVLEAIFFAIVASLVCKRSYAFASNESIFCANSENGNFLGTPASLVAIDEHMPAACASVGLTVTIRMIYWYPPLRVCNAFDNLPNGRIMRGIHFSTEGTKVLGEEGGQLIHPRLPDTHSKRF
jgi:hypothetical protein